MGLPLFRNTQDLSVPEFCHVPFRNVLKRTTGTAALVGVILGFVLAIFFNSFAVDIFGKETWLYTAFTYEKLEGGVVHAITEIPFLINMGWSFVITIAVMILISLAGPKVNPKALLSTPLCSR